MPLAGFEGDLTRMGMLPESHFGWRKQQPAIDSKLIHQSAMQDADVLVIGDSFSDNSIWHSLVWQTALTRHGLKVRTESWATMRGICTDFSTWLKSQGFHGKFVVLEIVERDISDQIKRSLSCQQMQPSLSSSADRPRFSPSISFDRSRNDLSGRFSIAIQTAANLRRYLELSQSAGFRFAALTNNVRVARIPQGCELFSHTDCNDALFFAEDRAEDLTSNTLDDIEKLNQRMPDVTPIWVFVPNKSTAYLYPDKRFWGQVEHRVNAPNILRMTQKARQDKIVDLYPANNTHFSTEGYLLMGEEIYQHLLRHQLEKSAQ